MIMPEWVGIAGIVVAVGLIIFLSMRGYNIVFIAPLASILVMLTNNMDIYTATISGPTSFMMGMAKYIINYFVIFLLGSILAKYIEVSGAAISIAKSIMKLTGTEKPYALFVAILLIGAVLTYGGISLFVVMFAIIPLARPIFKQMNLAWNLILIPVMIGVATFTMTMLPGTPSIHNVIPTSMLNTNLTAAPILGLLGAAAALAFGLWYMKYELNKSIRNGKRYSDYCLDTDEKAVAEIERIPNVLVSIFPLALLVAIIFIGSLMKVTNIILIGLIAANIAAGAVFNTYIRSHKEIINEGSQNSVFMIFLTSAAVGFGTVITSAPAYGLISDAIFHMPVSPLLSLSAASMMMAIVTGSSSGTIAIIISACGQTYIDLGISPDVIHRVTVVASSVLTAVPHCGLYLSFLALTKLNHKNTFKYFLITLSGCNAAALIVILLGNIGLGLK